ncbi:MBL fold metallo-hydrolase [Actinokineospora sp. PR83]|uniref:MBL fold metallo-hydrolase n=1 Tax=Actinokineospora sp. PR83 TaxID=2884908 RepID=UPI001F20BECD|nr:MBL fold metallo-hydrolase [Actinokineospora sp. PR83]MCG8917470.1 MBL fold metallo-hydrolase [Actinokineospora sp. PR83]
MRVRHLDCGPMRPLGGSLVDGRPGLLRPAEVCCHVLVVESADGLVLVDSGFSRADLTTPRGTLPPPFLLVARPRLDPAVTAFEQLKALGHDPADVRHIILTHLDLDHVGGISDFPEAAVHVHGPEFRAAMNPRTAAEKTRYRKAQWAHGPKWQVHEPAGGDRWFGLESVRPLPDLPEDDFLLVPLPGHTRGHAGVAVRTDSGWLLHAGDAYFHRDQLNPTPSIPPLLKAFEARAQTIAETRLANQQRLRDLHRDNDGITVFSAHDNTELTRFTS